MDTRLSAEEEDKIFHTSVEEEGLSDLLTQLAEHGYTRRADFLDKTSVGLLAEVRGDGAPMVRPSSSEVRRLRELLVLVHGVSYDIAAFFDAIALPQYIPLFVEHGFMQLEDLLQLAPEDLESALHVPLLAHRKRIMAHVRAQQESQGSGGWAGFVVGGIMHCVGGVLSMLWWACVAGLVGLVVVIAHPVTRPHVLKGMTVGGVMGWYYARRWYREYMGLTPKKGEPPLEDTPGDVGAGAAQNATAPVRFQSAEYNSDDEGFEYNFGESPSSFKTSPGGSSRTQSRVGAGSGVGHAGGRAQGAFCCMFAQKDRPHSGDY